MWKEFLLFTSKGGKIPHNTPQLPLASRMDISAEVTVALPDYCLEEGNNVSWTEKYERLNEAALGETKLWQ